MNKEDVRILILDDEVIIARDLCRIVNNYGYSNVQLAYNAQNAIQKANEFLPHIVISDINLEDNNYDGVDVAHRILQTLKAEIIFITAHSTDTLIQKAIALKPSNYLLKPFDENQVAIAIDLAIPLKNYEDYGCLIDSPIQNLSNKERQVIKLIAEGLTSKEIARQLNLSLKTIENHRAHIAQKLNLKPRNNSLLTWALEHKNKLD